MHWHVAVMIPDHPRVHEYAQWHGQQQVDHSVPLIIESVHNYCCEYGAEAVMKTLQSLRMHGRPLPTWVGVVHPMDLDVQVS